MTSTYEITPEENQDLALFAEPSGEDAPIALTQPAHELALDLVKLGALEAAVELPSSMDRSPLTELRRKGVIKTVGGTRGRPGRVSLQVNVDRFVLSQRRRPSHTPSAASGRPTIIRTRPTVEDLRALLAAIDEHERELHSRLSHEVEASISGLKRELMAAKSGSGEERDLFDRLSAEMHRLRELESEIRTEALKRIEAAKGPLAAFAVLVSRERPQS